MPLFDALGLKDYDNEDIIKLKHTTTVLTIDYMNTKYYIHVIKINQCMWISFSICMCKGIQVTVNL
jgi:hypothetical protein